MSILPCVFQREALNFESRNQGPDQVLTWRAFLLLWLKLKHQVIVTAAMHKNWFVVCLFFLFRVSGALLTLPGKQAHAGDVLSAVRVLTNKATYGRGERIVVTIHNELTTFLYAPPREPYCSVISVQRLEAGKWVPKESCTTPAPSDPPSIIAIAPRSPTWGTLGGQLGFQGDAILLSVNRSNRLPRKKICVRHHQLNPGSKVNRFLRFPREGDDLHLAP